MKDTPSKQPATEKEQAGPAAQTSGRPSYGFFENAAVWLLSRLPWFNVRYQHWSKTKRVIIGLLLYLIVLPVIPLAIGIIMYMRDPEGFIKGNGFKVLAAVTVAWLGAFGLVAMQPAVPENPLNDTAKVEQFNSEQKSTPEAKKADDSDTEKASEKSPERQSVQEKSESADTKGRFFKNCDAAFAAGVFDIQRSDPAYQSRLDRDGDGVACEK